ncbi:endolytic transglycosylase MltG [Candidatus Nomurabacteria bacterium]|nr:endolytic transglycosylase MltG [Candidatus Nomurabacteria bacterium]
MENKKIAIYISSAIVFFILFLSAPRDFPAGVTIQVEKGASLRSVSSILKQEHIIKSKVAFEFFVILFGKEKNIISANYTFERKLPVFEVARRIGGGEHRTAPASVTIPEGFDVNQIGDMFALQLQNFNKTEFLLKAKDMEGYLFPDTYFFFKNADEDVVLKSMSDNFEKKIVPLRPEILASGKSEKDIIIMASIIEREAKGDDDREVISGILWRRIGINMALQVDAVPDSYKTRGLPKSPIGNPGIEAINAAIHTQNSPYLYYLHDKEGAIHYAKNFIEHKANIEKYLK